MAVVVVRPLNILGGGKPRVTRVQDAFNRGIVNPPAPPPIWYPTNVQVGPVVTPLLFGNVFAGVETDALNGVILSAYGSDNPGTSYPVAMVPANFDSSVWGQTQYAQAKYVSRSGAALGGIAVMLDLSNGGSAGFSCYALGVTGANVFRLARYVLSNTGVALTETDINVAFGAFTPGDVMRLSCSVVVNANVLTVTQNGTQILQASDGVGSLTTGLPGFAEVGLGKTAGVAGQVQLRNFDGGLGL